MPLKILYLVAFLLINGSCSLPQEGKKKNYVFYPVTKVVDGDTFWIDDGSRNPIKIRLIGVDAPESKNTGRKLKAFYGEESARYLERLLQGKKVRLEYDIGHNDVYNRTLAYVYLEDGTFVNAHLVKNGYAMALTVPPNVKYADTFVKLARRARLHHKGLWNPKGEMAER